MNMSVLMSALTFLFLWGLLCGLSKTLSMVFKDNEFITDVHSFVSDDTTGVCLVSIGLILGMIGSSEI